MQDLSKVEKIEPKYKEFWCRMIPKDVPAVCLTHSIPQTHANPYFNWGPDEAGRYQVILLAPESKEAELRADNRIGELSDPPKCKITLE